jgi:hypothetical protein
MDDPASKGAEMLCLEIGILIEIDFDNDQIRGKI